MTMPYSPNRQKQVGYNAQRLPPEVELSNCVVRHFRRALLPVSAGTGGTAWESSCINTGHTCLPPPWDSSWISTRHTCLPCSQHRHVRSCGAWRPLSLCQRCQHDIYFYMLNKQAKQVGYNAQRLGWSSQNVSLPIPHTTSATVAGLKLHVAFESATHLCPRRGRFSARIS